ncbi:MAG: hypothetical protein ACFFAH_14980 [Promethearchaeota archaeon]
MALEPLDIVNGIFGLLFVLISIIVGVIIIKKYFKNKDINLLLVGMTWILLASGWYGTSTSFLVALFTGTDGLSFVMIMLLNFIPLPFALIFWMIAFTNFLYKDKQKIILGVVCIFITVFYSVFFYFLFTNPIIIGEKVSPVDTKGNSPILGIFILILVGLLLITGLKFALETMKFEDSETKLKGKLLLIAFPSFVIGAALDALMPTTAITLVIFRLILIFSAFFFYSAFILPDWMKSLLLKKKE